jgi:hypothetical protein
MHYLERRYHMAKMPMKPKGGKKMPMGGKMPKGGKC